MTSKLPGLKICTCSLFFAFESFITAKRQRHLDDIYNLRPKLTRILRPLPVFTVPFSRTELNVRHVRSSHQNFTKEQKDKCGKFDLNRKT